MKTISTVDVLIVHSNHNIPFHIYNDASEYQMQAVITQQKYTVAH